MITDVTMEHYDRTMDIDLRGVLLGMKHGIRAMPETGGGSIINWSSVGGLNGSPCTGVYTAAKAGVDRGHEDRRHRVRHATSGSTRSAPASS